MRKLILLLIFIISAALGTSAQEATIKRVEPIPFEVIPALQQRKDLNGEPCALVRVEVIADDVKFSGNIIGEVEHATGHYRVFLSPGTKMLRIESNSFLPVFITFPDYGIKGVQPNAVYVITLSLPQTPATTPLKTGTLSVNYEPAGAAITIDSKPYGTTPSTIANLSVGQHTVTISADGYTPATLTATVTEGQLTPLSGALTPKPAAVTASEQVDYYRFQNPSTKKYGFKDESGQIVVPAKFDNAWSFSEGLAGVELNGKFGFIDKTGQIVIPAKFDWAESFKEGLARVKLNGKYGFIDRTGELVIPAEFDNTSSFSEGLVWVELKLNGKRGFIDKTGEFMIPAKFDLAGNFSEGLAAVKINFNDKWGFIDKTGELVIPTKFNEVWDFSEGLAAVELNGKWGFINKTGEVVIPIIFDSADAFLEGFACVKSNGREFYIDKQGNEVK